MMHYLYGGVIVLLTLTLTSFYFDNKDLKVNLTLANAKSIVGEVNNSTLRTSIEIQNEKIIEYIYIPQPPEIRYKTIEKIREVVSNDCEDIKRILNDVRAINFNGM